VKNRMAGGGIEDFKRSSPQLLKWDENSVHRINEDQKRCGKNNKHSLKHEATGGGGY